MNLSAINAVEINGRGPVDVAVGDGAATSALVVAGDGYLGNTSPGVAGLTLSSTADLYKRAPMEGSTLMTLQAAGSIIRAAMLDGDTSMPLDVEGDLIRWARDYGDLGMMLGLQGDGYIRGKVLLEGSAVMSLLADGGDIDTRRARFLAGQAIMELVATAKPAMKVSSPPGLADIRLVLTGEIRTNNMVPLQGAATMTVIVSGDGRRFHLVALDGEAGMQLSVEANRAGIPVIPSVFIEAPKDRWLSVPSEARAFIVPQDRRL